MSRRPLLLLLTAGSLALAGPAEPAAAQSGTTYTVAGITFTVPGADPYTDADVWDDGEQDPYTDVFDGAGDPGSGSGSTGPTTAPAPAVPPQPTTPLVTKGTVKGKVARLRTNGKAAIPRGAPKRVRAIIAAANEIIGKPYKWGGGHARVADRGYDCSGAVSYALIRSGHLASPLVSGSLARYGSAGYGRWATIYANKGHVYMEVAGLRLDTSAVGDPTRASGVRWRPVIGKRPGFHVRHVTGL